MLRPNDGAPAISARTVVQYIIRAAEDVKAAPELGDGADPELKALPANRPTIAQVSAEWTLNQQQHSAFVVLASAVLESILSYFEHDKSGDEKGDEKGAVADPVIGDVPSQATLLAARSRLERLLPPQDSGSSRLQVCYNSTRCAMWCERSADPSVLCAMRCADADVSHRIRRNRQVSGRAGRSRLCSALARDFHGVRQRHIRDCSGQSEWLDVPKRGRVPIQWPRVCAVVAVPRVAPNWVDDRRRSQSDEVQRPVPTPSATGPIETIAPSQIWRRAHRFHG